MPFFSGPIGQLLVRRHPCVRTVMPFWAGRCQQPFVLVTPCASYDGSNKGQRVGIERSIQPHTVISGFRNRCQHAERVPKLSGTGRTPFSRYAKAIWWRSWRSRRGPHRSPTAMSRRACSVTHHQGVGGQFACLLFVQLAQRFWRTYRKRTHAALDRRCRVGGPQKCSKVSLRLTQSTRMPPV